MRLLAYFPRSTLGVLLLNAISVWLLIRIQYLPNDPRRWALQTSLATTASMALASIEYRLGFALPADAGLLAPLIFDEAVLHFDPSLAVAMGLVGPCDQRVTKTDSKGSCIATNALACHEHSSRKEAGIARWKGMQYCYDDTGMTAAEAREHCKMCHSPGTVSPSNGFGACTRVKMGVSERKMQCAAENTLMECAKSYGVEQEVLEALKAMPNVRVSRPD